MNIDHLQGVARGRLEELQAEDAPQAPHDARVAPAVGAPSPGEAQRGGGECGGLHVTDYRRAGDERANILLKLNI